MWRASDAIYARLQADARQVAAFARTAVRRISLVCPSMERIGASPLILATLTTAHRVEYGFWGILIGALLLSFGIWYSADGGSGGGVFWGFLGVCVLIGGIGAALGLIK